MTNNARQIHDNDEMIADMRALGAGLGAMYEELLEKGIKGRHAIQVLCDYLASLHVDGSDEEYDD